MNAITREVPTISQDCTLSCNDTELQPKPPSRKQTLIVSLGHGEESSLRDVYLTLLTMASSLTHSPSLALGCCFQLLLLAPLSGGALTSAF